MKVGTQKRIPATQPGEKQKRHIFGGYNWLKDTMTWTVAKTKNSATFIDFLEELLVKNYPTGRVILVMDNASYHKSAAALAALSLSCALISLRFASTNLRFWSTVVL